MCAQQVALDPRFTEELQHGLRSSAFYLYRDLQEIDSTNVQGSGVLVGYPIGNPVTHWSMYLVAPAEIVTSGDAAVGRMNRAGGGAFPLATSADIWHSPDPAGLAVCLIGLVWEHVDFRFVPLRPHCADYGLIDRFNIQSGHPVAAVTASSGNITADRYVPSVLAASLRVREPGAYEIEAPQLEALLPGAGIYTFTDDAFFDRQLLGMESPYWGPWLVGLMAKQAAGHSEATASIIPAASLHELLNSTHIREQRDQHLKDIIRDEPRVTSVSARPVTPAPPKRRKPRTASGRNLHALDLYRMITNDFETAWDAIASYRTDGSGRGNFMLCRQAMTLLEWIANVCEDDATGTALANVSMALAYIDRRYFTLMPEGTSLSHKDVLAHPLPTAGHPHSELLSVVFDLARHGLAHQYQQVVATLSDGTDFSVQLTGAEFGRTLEAIRSERPERVIPGRVPTTTRHLTYSKEPGLILLTVSPAILYLDVKRAIELSGLLSRVAQFPYITRKGNYRFPAQSLEDALRAGGHPEFNRPRPRH